MKKLVLFSSILLALSLVGCSNNANGGNGGNGGNSGGNSSKEISFTEWAQKVDQIVKNEKYHYQSMVLNLNSVYNLLDARGDYYDLRYDFNYEIKNKDYTCTAIYDNHEEFDQFYNNGNKYRFDKNYLGIFQMARMFDSEDGYYNVAKAKQVAAYLINLSKGDLSEYVDNNDGSYSIRLKDSNFLFIVDSFKVQFFENLSLKITVKEFERSEWNPDVTGSDYDTIVTSYEETCSFDKYGYLTNVSTKYNGHQTGTKPDKDDPKIRYTYDFSWSYKYDASMKFEGTYVAPPEPEKPVEITFDEWKNKVSVLPNHTYARAVIKNFVIYGNSVPDINCTWDSKSNSFVADLEDYVEYSNYLTSTAQYCSSNLSQVDVAALDYYIFYSDLSIGSATNLEEEFKLEFNQYGYLIKYSQTTPYGKISFDVTYYD